VQGITLQSKLAASKAKEATKQIKESKNTKTTSKVTSKTQLPDDKYKIYFDFQCRLPNLKPYQVILLFCILGLGTFLFVKAPRLVFYLSRHLD